MSQLLHPLPFVLPWSHPGTIRGNLQMHGMCSGQVNLMFYRGFELIAKQSRFKNANVPLTQTPLPSVWQSG